MAKSPTPQETPKGIQLPAKETEPEAAPMFVVSDMDCEIEKLPDTELRALVERLRDELRRRTVALASAVHELRTPLAVMDGYIDLLCTGKAGSLSEKQGQIMAEMQANAKRLRNFIADFLTFTAIENRSLNLNLEVHDMNQCAAEVCSMWMPRFHEKKVALYFLPSEELEPFSFDHLKVQHVISNLLHNALKFSPTNGTVWVSTERLSWERRLREEPLTAEERRRQKSRLPKAAKITVSDTGPGIEPEFHQEIFQEFRRLSRPGNAADSMGLGLAIARRLVQGHGGKIWVESKHGAGSRFIFLIPVPRD